jgi:hypothetical protein
LFFRTFGQKKSGISIFQKNPIEESTGKEIIALED